MELRVDEILPPLGGHLEGDFGGDRCFTGLSVDTRTLKEGDLFFAIQGPNFDGHRFVGEAVKRGAAGAVIRGLEKVPPIEGDFPLITVTDTVKGLGDLARYIRGRCAVPVIGITGSSGKTTVKEMVGAILSRSHKVLMTEGNRNNLIGMPLTLATLDESYDAVVLELGISEVGEMESLVSICRPDIGLLTNVGNCHLEGLGSLEGVAKAKGHLLTDLGTQGIQAFNVDDPHILKVIEDFDKGREEAGWPLEDDDYRTAGGRLTFSGSLGGRIGVDVRVGEVRDHGLKGIGVTYFVKGKELDVNFKVPGIHNGINGAAAICATLPFNLPLEGVKESLESFAPIGHRLEVIEREGVTIIDDSYNANPESVKSALTLLASAEGGRRVAVLGDMLELGSASIELHREVGLLAAKAGVEVLVTVGEYASFTKEGALAGGIPRENVSSYHERHGLAGIIRGILMRGDTVLVKGSRSVGLDSIVSDLK